jgi:hypothetical protein
LTSNVAISALLDYGDEMDVLQAELQVYILHAYAFGAREGLEG